MKTARTMNRVQTVREELSNIIIEANLDNDHQSAFVLAKAVKALDDAISTLEGQSTEGGSKHTAPLSGTSEQYPLSELSTEDHEFYRERSRMVRIGKKKDGVTEYRTSFTKKDLDAFIVILDSVDPNDFKMNGGLLLALEDGKGDLSRDKAYLVKSWLVAGGFIEEEGRNRYRITSPSIGASAEQLWADTPTLRNRA